jgi:hypothetical protein
VNKSCVCVNEKYLTYDHASDLEKQWDLLPDTRKALILKYATLLRRFNKDPNSVSKEFKKFILENSECETWLIPGNATQRYILV